MRPPYALLLLASLSLTFHPTVAQMSQPAENKPWAAEWITAADAPQREEVILNFRKVIDLHEAPQHFVIDVSADNQFIFYVNQQRVGTGPSRSDLAHWRYETYDIGPLLHAGKNVFAAEVWNFGLRAALAQMTDRVGFLVHGQSDAERAADTNDSWWVEQSDGIDAIHPDIRGYYAAEPMEKLDAIAFDWAWNGDTRSDGPWARAATIGRSALRGDTDAHVNWQLVPDPLPAMETKEVPAGRVVRASGVSMPNGFPSTEFEVPAHTKASILIDNSHLTTGYPVLTVAEGFGSTIKLTYSEALVDKNGKKGNRDQIEGKHIVGVSDEFLPNGESCEFMPLTWRTWRYLQLDIETKDNPLQVKQLKSWFTAYPFVEAGRFQSDDPMLQRIWETGWRTARLDAHDTYMDTPYWERLQYVGDTRIQALISYAVAGDDRLARQAIEAFNNSRVPDGLTQSRYPSSLTQMIPTFSLLWIGMVHDFWMYRDDSVFVGAQIPGIRAVLQWYMQRVRPDGLLAKLPWWPFVDWGQDFDFGMPPQDQDGGSAVITLQFVEALRYAAEIEAALGDAHEADIYRAAATRSAEAVHKLCWNQQYGLLADTPAQRHFSQHANILGVWLDVIPPNLQKNVLTTVLSSSDAGFTATGPVPFMTPATYYFRFYLARAVDHAGMADQYLNLLGPWKNMLSLGLSTWAESPEPTRSDSHAWSSHPNFDLLTLVAGFKPKSPDFKAITIEPHLGNLDHVNATIPTPRGVVTAEYKHTNKNIEAEFTLPEAMAGELVWRGKTIPLHGHQTLTLPLEK